MRLQIKKKLKKKAQARSAKAAGKKPPAKKKVARKRAVPSPAPDTQGGFAKPKRRKNPGPLD